MWREQDAWNIEPQHVFFNPYQRPICDEAFFKEVGNGFDIWQDSKYVSAHIRNIMIGKMFKFKFIRHYVVTQKCYEW